MLPCCHLPPGLKWSLFPMILVKICRRCSSNTWHLRLRECPTSPFNGLAIRYELKHSHVGVIEALSSLNFANCVHLCFNTNKVSNDFIYLLKMEYCKYGLHIMHIVHVQYKKCFSLGAAQRALHAHDTNLCSFTISQGERTGFKPRLNKEWN